MVKNGYFSVLQVFSESTNTINLENWFLSYGDLEITKSLMVEH